MDNSFHPFDADVNLSRLLMVLVEGTISAEQHEELSDLLIHDAQARQFYLRFMQTHALLHWQFGAVGDVGLQTAGMQELGAEAENTVEFEPQTELVTRESLLAEVMEQERIAREARETIAREEKQRKHAEQAERARLQRMLMGQDGKEQKIIRHYIIPRPVAYAAVIGLLALGLWVYSLASSTQMNPVFAPEPTFASVVEENGAVWEEETYNIGQRLGVGQYRLIEGRCRLQFDNGAAVTLQGPVAFEVSTDKRIELHAGRLIGRCPTPQSKGFTVSHGAVRVVDVGTEFGVQVSEQGLDVIVFDGKVTCKVLDEHGQADSLLELNGGQAARVAPGEQHFTRSSIDLQPFADMRGESRRWMVGMQGPVYLENAPTDINLQDIAIDERGDIYWVYIHTLIKTDWNGKTLIRKSVAAHQGALEYHEGKLYCTVTYGEFNQPAGSADSWIYVYDADDLSLLEKHPVPELVHGAGALVHYRNRFFVVGGLLKGAKQNSIFEYDEQFNFIRRHTVDTGYTQQGIQNLTVIDDHFYLSCYGSPEVLFVTDAQFNVLHEQIFDASYALEPVHGRQVMVMARTYAPGALGVAVVADDKRLRMKNVPGGL